LGELDVRSLTLTGGLPYHGGAGNNYLAHSIATLVERLRADPSAFGMVSGVGMHMTNHVFGVYSGTPGTVEPPDEAGVRQHLAQEPRRSIRKTATGRATLATYSVVHERQGPIWGLAVCDLPEGDRCYARIEEPEMLEAMEKTEWVGRELRLRPGPPGVNQAGEYSH